MLWGVGRLFTDPAWVQGIGSLLAVVVAIGLAFDQRRASDRAIAEQNLREHRADRAMLTFALNHLRMYGARCIRETAGLLAGRHETDVVVPKGWLAPELPEQSLRDIAKCVQSSPRTAPAQAFADLLEFAQVQNARLHTLEEGAGKVLGSFEVAGYVCDSVELAAMTDSCFRYARFETEIISVKVDKSNLESTARLERIYREDDSFEPFFFLIENRE